MLPAERYEQILKYLSVHSHVKISQLCQMLKVTEPTLRTDLTYLESQGKLIKIRGGAAANSSHAGDLSLAIRGETMGKEKSAVAAAVLKSIPDGAVLFMDASTTVLKVAQALALDRTKKVTVITNFLDIAQVLLHNTQITVVFCGGVINAANRYTLGEDAIRAFSFYYADIGLVGCQGVSKDKGFFNGSLDTSAVKKIIFENSQKTWVCMDHSKFNRSGLIKFLDFSEVDSLFTDYIPEDWVSFSSTLPMKIIAAE